MPKLITDETDDADEHGFCSLLKSSLPVSIR